VDAPVPSLTSCTGVCRLGLGTSTRDLGRTRNDVDHALFARDHATWTWWGYRVLQLNVAASHGTDGVLHRTVRWGDQRNASRRLRPLSAVSHLVPYHLECDKVCGDCNFCHAFHAACVARPARTANIAEERWHLCKWPGTPMNAAPSARFATCRPLRVDVLPGESQ
jgi:hypothetical protein